jgi:hypothetical protein
MASNRRGFSEKLYYAYNPFPSGFTRADIVARANLEPRDGEELLEAFPVEGTYATGNDSEWISLKPGETLVLRGEADAMSISEMFRDTSCVVILPAPPDTCPQDCLNESIRALRPVQNYFRSRGKTQAYKMMQDAKIPREEREENRFVFWPYFENQARAEIIEEHIAKLKAELAALKTIPKADDEDTESAAPRARFNKPPARSGHK